jgi:hypothetical protein
MEIQSLSIAVPGKKCVNNCKFCVSKMHNSNYPDYISWDEFNVEKCSKSEHDYIGKLEFVRDNNCHIVMLTGSIEPMQNTNFLRRFAFMNNQLKNPFKWIEMQSSGLFLNDPQKLEFLKDEVKVKTISLSISSLNNDVNNEIIGFPENHRIDIADVCSKIKDFGFNLRLSINLNKDFETRYGFDIDNFMDELLYLKPDQITFRKLYISSSIETPENTWIYENYYSDEYYNTLVSYIQSGKLIDIIPYDRSKYSFHGVGVMINDNCMNKPIIEGNYEYMILRENCKLYSKWDDPASLIF